MKKILLFILTLATVSGWAQDLKQLADSFCNAYQVPEMAYAVVDKTTIIVKGFTGKHAIHLNEPAQENDRFHIGSNTKAMTAFMIAHFVEQGLLNWETKFFDLYPEWKKKSHKKFRNITLKQLLSHTAGIQPFTSGLEFLVLPKFEGTPQEKRLKFCQEILKHEPVAIDTAKGFTYSNAGYAIAAIMLEKVTGKSWEDLFLHVFKDELKIDFGFSWPNNINTSQTWGHTQNNDSLKALRSDIEYRLSLIEPAGDVNICLNDYIKFIQMNIAGLQGEDNYLKSSTYKFLHAGVENYAMGWSNSKGKEVSSHSGSAGTYFVTVSIDRKSGKAFIVFGNSGTPNATQGITRFAKRLKLNYN